MVHLHDPSLRRYLLGGLPEDEREAVEHEYFADADLVDRLSEVEDDLIDDYLSDRLGEDERGLFEQHYLTNPRHRTRVAVANALRDVAPQTTRRVPGHEPAWWVRLSAAVRAWPAVAQVAFAVVLLLAATGGAWLVGWGSGRIVVALFAPPRPPMPPTPLPSASVSPPPAPEPSIARATPPVIVAVSVSPVHVRSAQDAATIVVKPGADIVRLNLRGERGESTPAALRVVVRSVTGEEIWRGLATSAGGSDTAAFARADLPAGRLRPDDYVVQLLQAGPNGQEVERYRYFVRVRRPTTR